MDPVDKVIKYLRNFYLKNIHLVDTNMYNVSLIDVGLSGKIYLTSADNLAENVDTFKINGIISLAEPSIVFNDRMHLIFDIADNETKETIIEMSDIFEATLPIIHEKLTNNQNILIHCLAGCSRAPTLVIAYLMKYHFAQGEQGDRLYKSALYVHRFRPCIFPSVAFLKLLKSYSF